MVFLHASTTALAALVLLPAVSAHMELIYPPSLRSQHNPNAGKPDYMNHGPLDFFAKDYPCKDTPEGEDPNRLSDDINGRGKPTATWAAGSEQKFAVTGGAFHQGGSCQVSLSYDRGKTFKVMHSYIGSCPVGNGESEYKFIIPGDAPTGIALFAWTWFNQMGPREMYMNCANVIITEEEANSPGKSKTMSSLVDNFVANIGRGCTTTESRDVEFPNPGLYVTRTPSLYPVAAPIGDNCGPVGVGPPGAAAPKEEAASSSVKASASEAASSSKAQASSEAATSSSSAKSQSSSATAKVPVHQQLAVSSEDLKFELPPVNQQLTTSDDDLQAELPPPARIPTEPSSVSPRPSATPAEVKKVAEASSSSSAAASDTAKKCTKKSAR